MNKYQQKQGIFTALTKIIGFARMTNGMTSIYCVYKDGALRIEYGRVGDLEPFNVLHVPAKEGDADHKPANCDPMPLYSEISEKIDFEDATGQLQVFFCHLLVWGKVNSIIHDFDGEMYWGVSKSW